MLRTLRRTTPKVGGRRNIGKKEVRRLKPVFSVATPSVAQEQAPAVKEIKSQPKANTVAESQKVTIPDIPETKPQPVRSGGFSIKNIVHTENNVTEPKLVASQEGTSSYVETGLNVDQVGLIVAWRTFIKNLPVEETGVAQRLNQIEPKLIGDSEFEVVAENPNIEDILHSLVQRIVKFMQVQLNCPALKMTIRLRELSDKPRVLSKPEQIAEMKHQNPALGMLLKEFDLTL